MTARDWFMLGSRLLGLWVFYQGFGYLIAYVLYAIGYRSDANSDMSKSYLIHACAEIALAYYLLLGTRHLTKLVYGEEHNSEQAQENAKS
jgi:cyanate permease